MKCPKCNFDNPADTKFCGECAAPLHPSEEISAPLTETLETPKEELTTGSTFAGRYQIIEELGKGGMGSVYKAHDTEINEKVAIKLIKPEVAADKKTIERFRNELKFARKIRHKNVCQMYDLGEEKGTRYITMEYVHGEDLKRLIRKVGQMPLGRTISIAKQLCEGLAEAHKVGVIHRDLKPRNVMVDEEGNARIMDFGIARSLEAKSMTGAGVMIGTPEYMSPEQAEVKEVDQRSDIYSLGVILYEMVTGRVPFEGEIPLGIAMKHKSEKPEDPRKLNAQIPEDLSRVILRCMEKGKDERYQSASEVRSELEKIEKGIPTTERVVPERKPITSKEINIKFTLKKLFIPALVIIAIAIIGLIIWRPWSQKEAVLISPDKPSIAIMYFKNDTGDEGLDHWRSALSQWLITDLSQSRHINVLPGDRLFSILRKLNLLEAKSYATEDLEKVASEGRVNHIFQANFSRAGDIFRIDYSLQKADTLEPIGSDYVKGKGEESFPAMVDELTHRIKADFKLSEEEIASDLDKEVGKITTSAPEAYKYYSEGRKYHLSGDYRQSISFMERAIEIDPEFAMAYRSLAMAHSNLGNTEERLKYLKKAFELSDRISDKEKYWIQGDYYRRIEDNYDKAMEAYNKLLELDPDHYAGHNNIALIYADLEEWDKAIEHLEVCRENKAEYIGSYTNLARYYGAKGMYREAREVLRDYLKNVSEDARIHVFLANNYVSDGKLDLALEEADKAIALNPKSYNKNRIYYLQGDFAAVEKEYKEWMEEDEKRRHAQARHWLENLYRTKGKFEKAKEQAQLGLKLSEESDFEGWKREFHVKLAFIHLAAGSPEKALEEVNKLWKNAVESKALGYKYAALILKVYALLDMESLEEAQKTADELKELVEKEIYKKDIRLYYHLLGRIELEKENYSKAIEYLKKTLSMLNYGPLTWDADFIEPLALAYYRSGDLEKARKEYENIISLTSGRLDYGAIYAKSFYMLGKIYEQQGNSAKAIEHYEKFLDLWKEADPGISEVTDARKRLTALQNL